MRIIRFVADDGRVLCGEDRGDGTATVVQDLRGTLAAAAPSVRLSQLGGRNAIVADDDRNMREFICTVLEKSGCACTACADGAEAIQAIRNGPADLIVSDIMMPHHNGYEIFSAAKSRDANMPVLLVTGFGYDPNHSLLRASREGLGAILYKPFTPHQLIKQILRALETGPCSLDGMLQRTDEVASISSLLPPVRPGNIVCIGRNWPDGDAPPEPPAVEDLEVFLKPTTSVTADGQPVRLPAFENEDPQVDGEGELALVIGRTAENVTPEEGMRCILGYTIANDVTARRWQTAGGPPLWMRGKGFDSFCPLGPAIVTADELEPDDLTITTSINGQVVQRGSTAGMIRSVDRIVSDLSRFMRLDPGTVVLTGSPPRVEGSGDLSFLRSGDEMMVEIPGIGKLVNPVADSM